MKKTIFPLLATLALSLTTAATTRHFNCDEERVIKSTNSQILIDCRTFGFRAQDRYNGLQVAERRFDDADGGIGGYMKTDAFNACYASAHRSTFQCSQMLDSQTGAVLKLDGSTNGNIVSCAQTNGGDTCNMNIPCCDSQSICTSGDATQGICD